jgi:hypothetical protein
MLKISVRAIDSSRAVVCRSVSRFFGFNSIGEFHAIVFRNVVVVGASRPMVNRRAHVASDRSFVRIAARYSVIVVICTEPASSSMSEVLWLDRIGFTPQPFFS